MCWQRSARMSRKQRSSASVRRTDFWERLGLVLDDGYVDSWARDTTLSDLGMSVEQAFAAGTETRIVWDAVCATLDVPVTLR